MGAEAVDFNTLDIVCDSCHQDIKDSYISLYVEDNDCGITTEVIDHLFDPFFLTKEVSKGTGMGLSMVHGITHKHDGHILVESEVGKGTVIKILLPQVKTTEKVVKKAE